ncbi:MAG TPA: hypothetical protein VLG72_00205 [Nitrospirota bacterium]|nr:hypothetical protein [Nitrospirota bacterium]
MNKIGWEIRPFGLLVFIVVIAISCYAILRWVHRPPPASEHKET